MAHMAILSLRSLNRTLIDRQFLAEPAMSTPLEVVRHLVAMQGQFPNSPYLGLWARLASFRHEELAALLQEGKVVRSVTLRRTVHVSDADDYSWIRPTVQPVVRRGLQSAYYADEIEGLDLDELVRVGRELLTGQALARKALGKLLGERYPGRNGARLADSVEILAALTHAPRNGAWGGWRHPSNVAVALAEEQIGRPMSDSPRVEALIRRYLAAFGPASVMDVQAWSGLTRLREPIDAMRGDLRVYASEDGRELFDLPDATLGDPDRPVPVRFLPAFDNALLGHRDRTRVIGEADRKRYANGASGGIPMFLLDGFVAGTWELKGSTVTVTPLRPLRDSDAAAVLEEGRRLLAFIAPDDPDRAIVID